MSVRVGLSANATVKQPVVVGDIMGSFRRRMNITKSAAQSRIRRFARTVAVAVLAAMVVAIPDARAQLTFLRQGEADLIDVRGIQYDQWKAGTLRARDACIGPPRFRQCRCI